MSGPKYGTAQVDTRRLQELMSEVNTFLEDKRIEKVKEDIKMQKYKTNLLIKEFKNGIVYKIIEKADALCPESKELQALNNIIFQFEGFADDEFSDDGTLVDLFVSLLNYEEKADILKDYIFKAKQVADELNRKYKLEITADNDHSSFINKNIPLISPVSPRVKECYDTILSRSADNSYYENLKKNLDLIISNTKMDDDMKISRMNFQFESSGAIGNKALSSDEFPHQNETEFIKLKNEYEVLCEYCNVTPENITDLKLLEESISILKKMIENKKSDEYISETMKKVMSDLGYNVIRSDTVSNANKNIMKNFYDFSKNSILNISSSNDGAVMMEIMGKHTELTEEEKLTVKCDMDRFCPNYYIIKRELEKYGIILNNEKLFEANIKYVRGINTEDFNISKQVLKLKKEYTPENFGGNKLGG